MEIKLTVFFDEPFWVGVFEKEYDGKYETAKIVFGSEPKDYEVYDYLIHRFNQIRFSRPMNTEEKSVWKLNLKKINPKRMQRKIQQEVSSVGMGTKAQQAMKIEHELLKQERKTLSKEHREELERQLFGKRQQKKKEKKKGH